MTPSTTNYFPFNIKSTYHKLCKSAEKSRAIAEQAAALKVAAGLLEIGAGTAALVSLFATVRSLWFAPIAATCALSALALHDIRVISRNVEKLAEGGVIARTCARLSPKYFAKTVLKETLFAEDLLGSSLERRILAKKLS